MKKRYFVWHWTAHWAIPIQREFRSQPEWVMALETALQMSSYYTCETWRFYAVDEKP